MNNKIQLWERIQYLMIERWGIENQNRLAREAKVGVATVARIKTGDSSIGLDVLSRVATALGVEAWQLICPPDLAGTPHENLSPMALDLARSLDAIEDQAVHQKAYALASQILSFGTDPAVPALRQSAPAPSAAHSTAR